MDGRVIGNAICSDEVEYMQQKIEKGEHMENIK